MLLARVDRIKFDPELCGDGRDAAFLQRVIGHGAQVDAAFLDPPYNVRIGRHAVAAGSHREFAMAVNKRRTLTPVGFEH